MMHGTPERPPPPRAKNMPERKCAKRASPDSDHADRPTTAGLSLKRAASEGDQHDAKRAASEGDQHDAKRLRKVRLK